MENLETQWQILSFLELPQWFSEVVRRYCHNSDGRYAAQLLWQRGIQDPLQLPGYLDPDAYQPSSPFEFGVEMTNAIARLKQARENGEKVTIWGDFDADGVTSTSLLWEGLGEFFPQHLLLDYYIPNRLTESHGLNRGGIERLATTGTKLIVTCDTGSTNLEEIEYAQQLGIDLIVTDHHTLPEQRPSVTAIINPRYLSKDHPLYHLSGVAVAYKLIEALYQSLPDVPQQPLENLLDLVAIGLIADLVQLQGDCRYLAQQGIKQLQKQARNHTATRPGISCLLESCKRNGDRPTDISFGLGPRINAVSRIHGDASFCVELLTSRDVTRCQHLAFEAELANTRRKSLQNDIIKQVKYKLARIDLSTTFVIVLDDAQWQGGVLGLVAGQIAQEYGRPTILLSTGETEDNLAIARGSARSVNQIDLYQLVKSQASLLDRFGGHPFAAGLSLPVENISLFREGINQKLRQQLNTQLLIPKLEVDLTVTVSQLGKSLFEELNLLEPYGMGNPIPKLLIKNCWFKHVRNKNIQDQKGQKIQYIKTSFELWDNTVKQGLAGVWWGHYQHEIPQEVTCDAVVELYFNINAYQQKQRSQGYEIRLVAVRPSQENILFNSSGVEADFLIDQRNQSEFRIQHGDWTIGRGLQAADAGSADSPSENLRVPHRHNSEFKIVEQCPQSWQEIYQPYRQAIAHNQKLVLAYSFPEHLDPQTTWQQLVGIVKYLIRTGKTATREQIQAKLSLSDRCWQLALKALQASGIDYQVTEENYSFNWITDNFYAQTEAEITNFILAVEEEQFQRQYFAQVPLSVITHQLSIIG
ncbi:putative exonuclease, RecJ [Stanieria cyanosphaera PCC 7437]|uniref:Single-stranded-DNA-specific exonuclease RecJ n=1 Tax=Stanieria cyanosphaera (strain ATCC 29371 / PCC 7437) TaxID=111780 RepID=K9XQU5_STAC7|nr:single-stranded-DNA-specific exonuclease RecJ [Stanieria cyanosphaera]AFZ34898.1 putative exonuclease, RecJ [Stanieria cyanosphaera PCC 7437]